jgi:hypothetical protein
MSENDWKKAEMMVMMMMMRRRRRRRRKKKKKKKRSGRKGRDNQFQEGLDNVGRKRTHGRCLEEIMMVIRYNNRLR